MPGNTALLDPQLSFRAVAHEDTKLRSRYLELDDEMQPADIPAAQVEQLVRESMEYLEFVLVASTLREILGELNAESFREAGLTRTEIRDRVRSLTGLDLEAVLGRSAPVLQQASASNTSHRVVSLTAVVRFVRSILEACPIDLIDTLATARGLEQWGHRCRVSYEQLQAFTLRHDPRQRPRLALLGREYQNGALSVDDVALLLGSDPVDAIELLEKYGYSRAVETIRLSEQDRAELLQRIRSDRLKRGGQPAYSPEVVARSVIASERIEGVDARRWIPLGGH